jgi:ribosome assembly protein 1
VSVSDPIVPFRETIVPPPQVDMVNEAMEGENRCVKQPPDEADSCHVDIETPNKQCRFVIRAAPLPQDFTKLLETNHYLLRALASGAELTSRTLEEIAALRTSLEAAAKEEEQLSGCVERILSFGPKRAGSNILVNSVAGLHVATAWSQDRVREDGRADYLSSVLNGFQLAALAGPICEEPMMGVAFFIEEWTLQDEGETGWGPLSGQIVSTVKVRFCEIYVLYRYHIASDLAKF